MDPIDQYVATSRKGGFSDAQIRRALLKAGYPVKRVDAALGASRRSTTPLSPSILHKAEEILFRPETFFELVRAERLGSSLFYLFVISLLSAAVFSLFKIILQVGLSTNGFLLALDVLFSLFEVFWSAGWTVAGVFMSTALFLLFARLLKGTASFTDTFKVFVYSSTPTYVISIVLGPILAIVMATSLVKFTLEDFSTLGVSLFTLVAFLIIYLCAAIWSIVLFYKGMKFFYQKSGWWVTGVVVLQFAVVLAILLVLFLLFVIFIAAIVGLAAGVR